MTIRFAAPPDAIRARMNPRTVRAGRRSAANDNADGRASDAMLHAALRHFARHGLAAAHHARAQAEAALAANDRQGYRWWLDVCRALDWRMARELALGAGTGS